MTEALTLTLQPDGDVEARAHSVGVPGDGVEVVVVGADGTRLPDGESGELLIRGSVLCCGYTDPEVAALAFTEDGFLRTGDVGYRRADGRIGPAARRNSSSARARTSVRRKLSRCCSSSRRSPTSR
jgi:long-subunit acyl-CoA synthetase (AMP-forming)